ncbi:hypothetical protein [Desulfomonile tiedjei]|uniref:Uncharacterized protein n=1 Tax=Desulfomonile tiedjei (strain ATCC 49306 / DSM 6799 / DCB-1) TaxID=706587 RepID=I4C8Z6_DESTA|nr:hypothetical protein [Desulfomonile tiedjei]AFM26037.1 hypothetical protein Desti_3382 [Desulfomonile tiedjei DSM 6799]
MKIEEVEAMQELVRNMAGGFSVMVEAFQKTSELFTTMDAWLENAKASITDEQPEQEPL